MSSFPEKPIPQTPISSPSNSPQRKTSDLPKDKADKDARERVSPTTTAPPGKPSTATPRNAAPFTSALGPSMSTTAASSSGAGGAVVNEDEEMDLEDERALLRSRALEQDQGRRVKVYELIGGRWHDNGTGFVSTVYDEPADKAEILVLSEDDQNELLRRPIHVSDVYHRTHGGSHNHSEEEEPATGRNESGPPPTLITWTEPDGQDYALSFQDSEGCSDIWDFILDIQHHILSNQDTDSSLAGFSPPQPGPSSPFSSSSVPSSPERLGLPVSDVQLMITNILQRHDLPTPQLGNISDIEQAFKFVSRNPGTKQKLCEAIVGRDFWKQCIEVHEQAEDLESLEDLHALCKLAQTLLLLNDPNMYDYIVRDEVFLGVLGMLEYDPDFPHLKAGYRDFVQNVSHFREVMDLKDDVVLRKVHNVYRLQFLMDVVLARVLDDPVFNVLKSCMLFQQVDIIQYFSTEESLLREIFSYFDDIAEQTPEAPPSDAPDQKDKRGDLLLLLHQLCMMGKMVQLPTRVNLYRRLVDKGLVNALQWGLSSNIPQVRSATGEILTVVVDHDAASVRNFILNQVTPPPSTSPTVPGLKWLKKTTLMDTMQHLMSSPAVELALKSQLADATRTLLEVVGTDGPVPPDALQRAREDITIERFLSWFYGDPVRECFTPLLKLPEFQLTSKDPPTLPTPIKLTKAQVPHIHYLTELLATFAVQHTHRSSFFIMSSHISTRIGMLLLVKEKHIRIAALRFFRSLLRMGNQFVFRHLIGKDLFYPLVELAGRESKRDSLMSACYQEYFEYLRKENIRTVINQMLVAYGDQIRKIAADKTPMGRIFDGLVLRWEQNNDSSSLAQPIARPMASGGAMRWGQGQLPEAEEEDYFNGSDDEEDNATSPTLSLNGPKGLKRKENPLRIGLNGPPRPILPRPASLVDYEDNDGDEDMDKPDASPGTSKSLSPLEASPELQAAAQGADSPTVRHILRPRPLYTNGVKPSKGPPSPSLPIPSISRRRSTGSVSASSSESSESSRNGVRTPSPPPSKLRRSPPPSPRAGLSGAASPPRPSEKRKRDDDDDDLLGAMDRTNKRRSIGPEESHEVGMTLPRAIPMSSVGKEAEGKKGEGKKMKLKLGKSALTVSSTSSIHPTPLPAGTATATHTKDNG